jgi:hypothetical protein
VVSGSRLQAQTGLHGEHCLLKKKKKKKERKEKEKEKEK